MIKLQPLEINETEAVKVIDQCHIHFKTYVLNKDRPFLFGRFVYMPIKWIMNKAEIFWHVSSLGKDEVFNVFPCNNDKSYCICNNNCIDKNHSIELSNSEVRNVCYYRMLRVTWIRSIIELANNNDEHIKIWKKTKDKGENLFIRYIYDEIDYILVFAIRNNDYMLLSAYPLFYINSKINHTKDYEEFMKNKKPVIALRKPDSPSTHGR